MYDSNLEPYAMALWYTAWPDVDWYEASDEDKKLFRDHAHSLYIFTTGVDQ